MGEGDDAFAFKRVAAVGWDHAVTFWDDDARVRVNPRRRMRGEKAHGDADVLCVAAAPPETHTFEGVQITILRRHSATMPDELTVDDVKAMLDDGGFEGNLESITFVNEASQLPQNPHERILLLDVVRVLFNSAGADGGETVGASDLGEWIARHRLDGATELVDAATEIAQAGRRITFDDFKALLTRSKLLSFQRERGLVFL